MSASDCTEGCVHVERLEKYGERLEKYGERLVALEIGQSHMREAFRDTETRIEQMLKHLDETMEKQFEKLDHAINGNGKPGHEGRIAKLESLWWKLLGGGAALAGAMAVAEFIIHVARKG